jgi:hypothetical protein
VPFGKLAALYEVCFPRGKCGLLASSTGSVLTKHPPLLTGDVGAKSWFGSLRFSMPEDRGQKELDSRGLQTRGGDVSRGSLSAREATTDSLCTFRAESAAHQIRMCAGHHLSGPEIPPAAASPERERDMRVEDFPRGKSTRLGAFHFLPGRPALHVLASERALCCGMPSGF